MPLLDRIRAQIAHLGPLSVADYMDICLHDPQAGYYATRPALGEDGDFITAPLVSQMFGELIGLWAVEVWRGMGAPAPFILAEAGPGDGTLMADLLRAARLDDAFIAAAQLWLIETSAPLRARQASRLAQAPLEPRWADSLDALPAAPLIMVANELLDCLSARQFVRTPQGWAERRVGLSDDGGLAFGLMPALQPGLPDNAPMGQVLEVSAAQANFGAAVGRRIARDGGAALLIDYGRDAPGYGDTLQALARHRKVDPLADPGAADLTVHADFPAVLNAAKAAGVETAVLPQGQWLTRLGLDQRAAALSKAKPDQAGKLERQRARLADPGQMGDLFKAACVYSPGLSPPGF
jgi:NADH dehydrogenase [ubiquinone] 1 alpha subcomplex assembly factor 7